ncbi:MAG: HypC/HybG/HupF family hydrogenase formation chaperone [Bacteroidales bacterium]
MCLSIPALVEEINGDMATVSVGGARYEASLQMLEDVKPGDYILLHTGFAIQKLSEEEAKASLEAFEEFSELNRRLDEEEQQTGKRIV